MAIVETPEHDPYECPLTYDAYPDPSYCATPPYPLARFLGDDGGGFSTYNNNNQLDALPASPNAASDQRGYMDFWCAHYLPQDQSNSPGRSVYSSSHLSSDWSDPDSTPYSSPEPVNA